VGELATIPSAPPADFLVLGALEVLVDGCSVQLGAAQEKRLLAAVLSSHPNAVSRSSLIKAVWDATEPNDPVSAFDHVAMRLRKSLESAGLRGVLRGETGGYRLGLPQARVDVNQFRDLVAEADKWGTADPGKAAEILEAALGRFRGRPLEGLEGQWVDGYRHLLEEERYAAEISLTEAAIRLGRHRQHIPRLEALLQDRPDDECLTWLAMHAYYRAGRQVDAQSAYHRLRRELDERVATESHAALADLYQRMLSGDEQLLVPSALDFPVGRPARAAVGPGPSYQSPDMGADGDHSDHADADADDQDRPGADQPSANTAQTNIGGTVNAVQGGDGEYRRIKAKNYVEIHGGHQETVHIGDNFHSGPRSEKKRG
jgi:DNA-binding SARP family transcriptional activator